MCAAEASTRATEGDERTLKGTIDLGDVQEVRVSTAPAAREFELEVESPERTFRFQAEDDDDRGRWVEGLTAALRSVGPPAEGSAAGGVEVTDVDGSGIITVQWRLPPGSGCSDSDYLALCAARCTRPLASDLSRWAALLTPTALCSSDATFSRVLDMTVTG